MSPKCEQLQQCRFFQPNEDFEHFPICRKRAKIILQKTVPRIIDSPNTLSLGRRLLKIHDRIGIHRYACSIRDGKRIQVGYGEIANGQFVEGQICRAIGTSSESPEVVPEPMV